MQKINAMNTELLSIAQQRAETMTSLQIAEITGKGQIYFVNKFLSRNNATQKELIP